MSSSTKNVWAPTSVKDKTPLQAVKAIALHLARQNGQSIEGGDCLYRGPNGMSCAVGCVITDEYWVHYKVLHPNADVSTAYSFLSCSC